MTGTEKGDAEPDGTNGGTTGIAATLEERVNVQVAQVNEMNDFPSSTVCVLYTL